MYTNPGSGYVWCARTLDLVTFGAHGDALDIVARIELKGRIFDDNVLYVMEGQFTVTYEETRCYVSLLIISRVNGSVGGGGGQP